MKVAIIGSGITGLACSVRLAIKGYVRCMFSKQTARTVASLYDLMDVQFHKTIVSLNYFCWLSMPTIKL